MRRVITLLVLLALVLPVSVASAQKPNKTDVCHLDDEGNFIVISVANASLSDHLGHGDQVIGVDVDENCEPLLQVECVPLTTYLGPLLYTEVDGSNPQMGFNLYYDTACTVFHSAGAAWLAWGTTPAEAQTFCPGGLISSLTENLYICVPQ